MRFVASLLVKFFVVVGILATAYILYVMFSQRMPDPGVENWVDPTLGETGNGVRAHDASQGENEAVAEELLARQKRYALIIGNSAYTNGFQELPGVEDDLKVLPEALEKAGFSVTARSDLTSDTLEPAVRAFVEEFGSDEYNQLLIYFASHGATDSNGTGYIVPVDAPPPLADPTGFRRKSMSMNIVQAIAKDAIAKHVMFVFDACFAGTIFEGRRSATRTIREGFDKNTRFFITAGGADETVLDRSIFRDQFVRGVVGAADLDADDFITDVELGQFLAKSVYDDEHAPHRPRWGWLTDARFDKGVWAIPVPGSFRTSSSPGLGLGVRLLLSGKPEEARETWTKYALAGDVRVMKHLGDYYSGAALEEMGLVGSASSVAPDFVGDPVTAMTWYARVIAWFVARDRHDALVSNDKLFRQSLRAFIRLRASSSDAELAEALGRARSMLESGGAEDLYTVGLAYLIGLPLNYDLPQGMLYLKLAAVRGHVAAEREFEARQTLLTEGELMSVADKAARWQPLPSQSYQGGELERLRKELQEIQQQRALALVTDIDIDIVKRLLRSLGYYDGPIDNEINADFGAAVQRYQTAQKFEPTGVLTPTQTVQLVMQSADTGYPMGAYVLGVMYLRGIGVTADGALALKWLNAAADADLALAHYALAVAYRDGSNGVNPIAPNVEKAADHFARAAELGYAPAERALTQLKEAGPIAD